MQKILKLFVNTFTADYNHYLLNRDNFAQRIQMQLSQKQKSFSEIFFAFLKSKFTFKQFPKKMTLIGDVSPETPIPKNMV